MEKVGKFAEQGRRYFDLTWANAEDNARSTTFDKLQKRVAVPAASSSGQLTTGNDDDRGGGMPNVEAKGEDKPNLYHEGDPERRRFSLADPEGYAQEHRLELLGELIGMVERWKASGMPNAQVHSRFNKRGWGNIVGGILQACEEPDFLANAQEAAAQLDETRREFAELVSVLANHKQGNWTASELVELGRRHGLMAADLREGSPRSLATKLGTLAGRFVGESFPLSNERVAVFHRSGDRNGNVYRVAIQE